MMLKRIFFIGGCSRSGTTLLADRLGVGDSIVVTPESQFKVPALKIYKEQGLEAAVNYIRSDFRFRLWQVDIDGVSSLEIGSYTDLIMALVNLYARNQGVERWDTWIDHTPTNIRDHFLLKGPFPQAKYIHIIRDGRGVLASMKGLDWGRHNPIHGAQYWLERVAPGLALAGQGGAAQLKYEDLLADGNASLTKLCIEIDLTYFDKMLEGGGFMLPSYTAKQHKLVKNSLDKSRSLSWREKLTERECEIFEVYCGSVLDALGYEVIYKFPNSPTRLERLLMGDWPVKFNWNPIRRLKVRLRRWRALTGLGRAGKKSS